MRFTTIIALFNLIPILVIAGIPAVATSDDHYLLSCGSDVMAAGTPSIDYRTWYSDKNSTFSDSFSSTTAATTIPTLSVPFTTARVFTTNFTYTFPVLPGPKFIRLFFYPSPYPYSNPSAGLSLSSAEAYITVKANSDHLLLRNFSAYLNFNQTLEQFVQKEFYVQVTHSILQLTISPSQPGSHAFLNGIEVVSVPENLYIGSTPPVVVGGLSTTFNITPTTALENAYRVNVGGTDVTDSGIMYRHWEPDFPNYLVKTFTGFPGTNTTITVTYASWTPNYSAPTEVYQTFRSMGIISKSLNLRNNVTWRFEVDLGFSYLVRLHWCEIVVDVNSRNYRVFNVYIDGQIAEENVDIFGWVGRDKATYKDYVVYKDIGDGSSKGTLELAMHPYTKSDPIADDTLLNGLEIFKMNRSDGSLDAPNPSRTLPTTPTNQTQKSASNLIPAIVGAVVGAILLAALLSFLLISRRRKWSKMSAGSSGTTSSKSKRLLSSAKSAGTTQRSSAGGSLPSHLCRYFSLADIRNATSDFSSSLIIGHGGFGNVYKGTVNSETGPITVAIKRLNPLSGQGAREFTTEIELLTKLRHLHLVSLIGYCDEAGEMILVYEFMSHGTLRDHLYPSNTDHKTEITWCKRLEICIGAARGLHYLHTGTERMIIHRDVKSTNILLDVKWVAKVSDFGLSKIGPTGADYSHVSTAVKGSFGYVDPEYYRRQQLTEKSDVYSFGVVLFEVLCARAAVNPTLPKEQVNLRIWARRNQVSGTLDTIVDPTLKGQIVPESLRKFGEVAESCVRDEGAQRPSMADVIWGLEFALQLQMEAEAKSTVDENDVVATNITSPTTDTTVPLITSSGENTWTSTNDTSSGLYSSTTSVGYGDGSTDVFSQMFKPEGR